MNRTENGERRMENAGSRFIAPIRIFLSWRLPVNLKAETAAPRDPFSPIAVCGAPRTVISKNGILAVSGGELLNFDARFDLVWNQDELTR